MKEICEIRKRPSILAIVAVPFFIALFGSIFLATLQYFVSSIWLNSWLVSILAIAFLLAPILVWQSEFRILVEASETKFVAIRKLFVFKIPVAQRRFVELDDVYWKKEEHVEDNGPQHHVYGRRRTANGDLDSIEDVLISGGLGRLVSLTQNDVDQLRHGVRKLQDAQ